MAANLVIVSSLALPASIKEMGWLSGIKKAKQSSKSLA